MAIGPTRSRAQKQMDNPLLRARRSHKEISYHEYSTPEDESDESSADGRRRHCPPKQTVKRRTPVQRERIKITAPNSLSRARRSHKKISYQEHSTSEDEEDEGFAEDNEYHTPRPTARQNLENHRKRVKVTAPMTRSKRKTTQRRAAKKADGGRVRRQRGEEKKDQHRTGLTALNHTATFFTGKKMPWQTLPFEILVSTFAYASSPLISDPPQTNSSAKWLARVATICKAFTEPALSVLYFCPPIYDPSQSHQIASLLRRESNTTLVRYRHKIKFLEIHDTQFWTRAKTHRFSDLIEIILHAPMLRGVHIGMPMSNPKYYRPMRNIQPRTEKSDILLALEQAHITLRAWTWNFQVEEAFMDLRAIRDTHKTNLFQRLESLTMSNIRFDINPPIDESDEGQPKNVLAEVLSSIPSLTQLCLSILYIEGTELIPILPDGLKKLTILSCPYLESQELQAYLAIKGRDLEELVLSHNEALNLSFLPDLSWSCPRLKVLEMDLLFYNQYLNFRDAEPKFKMLLSPGEKPTWPTSLQRLEFAHLRKWETNVAEGFFSSLVAHAKALPDLSHLKIKASLDESSWRERAAFRDKWVSRLQDVFLRKVDVVDLYTEPKATGGPEPMDIDSDSGNPHSNPYTEGMESRTWQSAKASVNDSQPLELRRLRKRRAATYNEFSSDGEDSALGDDLAPQMQLIQTSSGNKSEEASDDQTHETFVQGRCDIVDIVIDNLRPTEEQLHESDFLDEEVSGDEDWNAEDDNIGGGIYSRFAG